MKTQQEIQDALTVLQKVVVIGDAMKLPGEPATPRLLETIAVIATIDWVLNDAGPIKTRIEEFKTILE